SRLTPGCWSCNTAGMTTILTSRHTRCIDLLRVIARKTREGYTPTKAEVVGNVPSQTRAHQYRMIDTLLRAGLAENVATNGNAYALRVTDAGLAELAAHGVELA